jgi:hypothetical protein
MLSENTNVMFGLRAELTNSVGSSITLKDAVTKNYLNVFPSVFIKRSINKQHANTFI